MTYLYNIIFSKLQVQNFLINFVHIYVLKIDSARKHGTLLEAIQILADLDLSIKKAYISSDGRWSMDGKYNHD